MTNTNYTVRVEYSHSVAPGSFEFKTFFNRFFNNMQRLVGLDMLGRKFFDRHQAAEFNQLGLEIWPGFSTSVIASPSGLLLQIDIAHRILRTNTVLDLIHQEMSRAQGSGRAQEAIVKALKQQVVLTRYNNKTYKITDVDFNMNPGMTFESRQGQPQSYVQYYANKWQQNITDLQQPLLKTKLAWSESDVYLVPSLCYLTGLTDEQVGDFQLMKTISAHTKKTPVAKMQTYQNLVTLFQTKQASREYTNDWGITVNANPVNVKARVLPVPNMQQGEQTIYVPDAGGSFDRQCQTKMYTQPKDGLKKWAVWYLQSEAQAYNNFRDTFVAVGATFNFPFAAPATFPMTSKNPEEWEASLRQVLSPDVEFVVLILPKIGRERKSNMYPPLKKLLTEELPVPSQVV